MLDYIVAFTGAVQFYIMYVILSYFWDISSKHSVYINFQFHMGHEPRSSGSRSTCLTHPPQLPPSADFLALFMNVTLHSFLSMKIAFCGRILWRAVSQPHHFLLPVCTGTCMPSVWKVMWYAFSGMLVEIISETVPKHSTEGRLFSSQNAVFIRCWVFNVKMPIISAQRIHQCVC